MIPEQQRLQDFLTALASTRNDLRSSVSYTHRISRMCVLNLC